MFMIARSNMFMIAALKSLSDHFNVCVTSTLVAVDCLLLRSEIFLVLPVLHNFGLCMGCFEYYLMRHYALFNTIDNIDNFILEDS